MQVGLGMLLSATMVGLGQVLIRRPLYRTYAQVLASGGIVVFFLSIYAAYNFYHLIGYGMAFTALTAAAVATSILALANRSEAVAVICLLGAFATPALIRDHTTVSEAGNLFRLYAYIAALDVWVLVLIRLRNWYSLAVVAFASTWVLFFGAGSIKGGGWMVEGVVTLFLGLACSMGLQALYSKQKTPDGQPITNTAATQQLGIGLILGGCLAFLVSSGLLLPSLGMLGLPDMIIPVMLLTVFLGSAVFMLPPLVENDRAIRQLFGSLAVLTLAVVMAMIVGIAAPTPHAQAPLAFGFSLFNYLIFLGVAGAMNRRAEGEEPAVALIAANLLFHLVMVFHVLEKVRLWSIPAYALWLPMAGGIALAAAVITVRHRQEQHVAPSALVVTAQVLPFCGLIGALIQASGEGAAPWPASGGLLFLVEFLLLSIAWIRLRSLFSPLPFRADLLATFGNAAVFFGLIAQSVRMATFNGVVLLAGYAFALAFYHAWIGMVVMRQAGDDLVRRLTCLGLAVAFFTIAIPLQMTYGVTGPIPPEQVPFAFGFALVSYLIFLGVACAMNRREEGEEPAAALIAANLLFHLVMIFHVLERTRLWGVPAFALWLPLAGGIALSAAGITTRRRRERQLVPSALVGAAQVLPVCGFIGALIQAGGPGSAAWPTSGGVLFLAEFLLLSAAWIRLRALFSPLSFRVDLLAAFGNAMVFFGLIAQSVRIETFNGVVLLAGYAVVMALYHAWIGAVVLRRTEDDLLRRLTYLGLAVTFLTIAIPLQLKASYITLTWAVEAGVLLWTGLRGNERRIRWYGLTLLLIAASKALFNDLTLVPQSSYLFLNPRMLSGASIIAVSSLSAWLLRRRRTPLPDEEQFVLPVLSIAANLFALLFVSVDLWDYVGRLWPASERQSAQQLALSLFWMVYAFGGILWGICRHSRTVRLFAMGLLYLSIGKVFLYDLSGLEPLARIVSFFTLGVILLLVSLLYTRFEARLQADEKADGGPTVSGKPPRTQPGMP